MLAAQGRAEGLGCDITGSAQQGAEVRAELQDCFRRPGALLRMPWERLEGEQRR